MLSACVGVKSAQAACALMTLGRLVWMDPFLIQCQVPRTLNQDFLDVSLHEAKIVIEFEHKFRYLFLT